MKKEITTNQFGIMIFCMFLCNKLLALPSLLYHEHLINSLIIVFVLLVFDFVLFSIGLRFIKNNKDITLCEALKKRTGMLFGKAIMIILALIFAFKFLFLFNESFIFFKELVYEEYTFPLFLMLFCLVGYILVKNKLNSLSRTFEIAFCVIIACLCIVIFSSFFSKAIALTYPYQIFNKSIASGCLKYLFFFTDSFFAFTLCGKVNVGKSFKSPYVYLSCAFAFVLLFFALYYFNYPVTASLHSIAITFLANFVPVVNDITNIDFFPIIAQTLLSFLQSAMFMHTILDLSQNTFTKKHSNIMLFVITICLFVICITLVNNLEICIELSTKIFNYICLAISLIFIYVFSIKNFNKGGLYEKNKKNI